MIKVFLSSTSRDLVEFRQRAEKAINSLDGFHCLAMENFGARDAAAEAYCPDLVAECELFVLLLGATYGSCPPNEDKSYTELEYDQAVALDKPRLVFAASDEFAIPRSLSDRLTDADKQKAQQFRQRVSTERIWGTFTTAEQLAALISQGIPNKYKQHEREQKEQAIAAYLDHLIERNTDLYPRGVMQTVRQVSLRLDEVYVSLKAERELRGRERGALWDVSLWDEDDLWQGPGGRRLPESFAERMADAPRKEEAEVYDAVREHARMVVLGDPGAGKTTLLRFLALQFARACQAEQPSVTDTEGRAYGPTRLPVFFRVADFADAFAKDRNLKLRNFLAVPFENVPVASAALQAALLEALQQGRALLLLDGLDEVIDTGDRAQIAGEIEAFVAALHPHNRVIVTSRLTGYREAALGGAYQHFTLLDLERPQIERFLTRWCQAQERFLSKDASDAEITRKAKLESDAILQAVDENPGVRRLAVNPLLLTILALIQRNGARLPNRRVELYDLAARTLLEDWQLARGVPSGKTVKEHEAAQFLWPLAHWLHREKPRGLATAAEIKQQLAHFLSTKRKLAPDDPDIIEAVNDFLHRVRYHTGLLVERAPNQYGFMHLTFEEYFAARELVRRPDQLAQKIYELRHQPRWQEPILLAIGYVSEHFPDMPAELIRTAILAEGDEAAAHGYQPSLYEDVLHRDLLFAVHCIGDCATIDADFRREIVQRLVKLYLDSQGPRKYQPLRERIGALLDYLKNTDAASDAAAQAVTVLQSEEEGVRTNAIHVLERLRANTAQVVSEVVRMLKDENTEVRRVSARALGSLKISTLDLETELLKALQDEDHSVSWEAAVALVKSGAQESLPNLIGLLSSGNRRVGGNVAYALGRIGKHEVVEILRKALRDENSSIRVNAVIALGETNSPDVMGDLLVALSDSFSDVRSVAAQALGSCKTIDSVNALIRALDDESREVRIRAAWSLLKINLPEAVSGLFKALEDKDTGVRSSAAFALHSLSINSPEVTHILLKAFKDGDVGVRTNIAAGLGRDQSPSSETVETMFAALCDNSDSARNNIAIGLGLIGSPEVEKKLIDMLESENEYLRVGATKALMRGKYGSSR